MFIVFTATPAGNGGNGLAEVPLESTLTPRIAIFPVRGLILLDCGANIIGKLYMPMIDYEDEPEKSEDFQSYQETHAMLTLEACNNQD